MTTYDFSSLNDKEFEILTCDLLSAEKGFRFERFKAGKDGGVDGRFFLPGDGKIIVQCKHWVRTSISQLIKSLRSTEIEKIKRITKPNYIFVTSLELSAKNKDDIYDIFSDYMDNSSSVLGREDLNDLLRKHSSIERGHFKLWLHSSEMLAIFQNSAILGRSEFTLEEIKTRNAGYVVTESHINAREKLYGQNVLLITGEPGIGKTTLAEQLCLEYVVAGYQLCVAAHSIEELESLYIQNKNQIFYFDDFLGSNFLLALQRHEDSHILGFIRRVCKDKSKKFILTSRTTILNRGKVLSDKFSNDKIEQHEFEIEIENLSTMDRAKILHNFIWHLGLPIEYIKILTRNNRYRNVINHRNYNPRLISFIVDFGRMVDVEPVNYWEYIENKLKNPSDVWEHVYNNQLNSGSRLILSLVVMSGGKMRDDELRNSYDEICKKSHFETYQNEINIDFNLRILCGSMLSRNISGKDHSYSVFNPSISDYILRKLASSPAQIFEILTSLSNRRSLSTFYSIINNKILKNTHILKIIEPLCEYALHRHSNDQNLLEYQLHVCYVATKASKGNIKICETVSAFIDNFSKRHDKEKYIWNLVSTITSLAEVGIYSETTLRLFFEDIDFDGEDNENLVNFSKLIKYLPADIKSDVTDRLKFEILNYWEGAFHDEIIIRGTLEDLTDEDDEDEAESLAESELDDILSDYKIKFSYSEKSDILHSCDFLAIIEENIEDKKIKRPVTSPRAYRTAKKTEGADDIDDLFSFDFP